MKMIDRFANPAARVEALCEQGIVRGRQECAELLAQKAQVREHPEGECFITQGDATDSIFFILSGRVEVRVNDRFKANRETGTHVGEVAMVQRAKGRIASVYAVGAGVVTAEVSEADFSAIADRFPFLWRRLAMETAERLRQRYAGEPPRNEVPKVFVGSSGKELGAAQAFSGALENEHCQTLLWDKPDQFPATLTNIEALERSFAKSDFAVLLLSPDDSILSKENPIQGAPRDNVVLELGMSLSALGRDRTFILCRGNETKIPTDLAGVTLLRYYQRPDKTLSFERAISQIKERITKNGSK